MPARPWGGARAQCFEGLVRVSRLAALGCDGAGCEGTEGTEGTEGRQGRPGTFSGLTAGRRPPLYILITGHSSLASLMTAAGCDLIFPPSPDENRTGRVSKG